jgi:hypothetical protein
MEREHKHLVSTTPVCLRLILVWTRLRPFWPLSAASAFAALQTDAVALRSQLFAEVKSLAQRISAAEEALTEARKREAAALGTHALISKNTNSNHDNIH